MKAEKATDALVCLLSSLLLMTPTSLLMESIGCVAMLAAAAVAPLSSSLLSFSSSSSTSSKKMSFRLSLWLLHMCWPTNLSILRCVDNVILVRPMSSASAASDASTSSSSCSSAAAAWSIASSSPAGESGAGSAASFLKPLERLALAFALDLPFGLGVLTTALATLDAPETYLSGTTMRCSWPLSSRTTQTEPVSK